MNKEGSMAKGKEERRKKKRLKEIRYEGKEREEDGKKRKRLEKLIVFISLKLLCWKIYRHLPPTVK